jgi:hypothetical protein
MCRVLAGSRAFCTSLCIRLPVSGQEKSDIARFARLSGNYSGFPCPSALSLMEARYRISRGAMPLCKAFHNFLADPASLHFDLNPPPIPVAPFYIGIPDLSHAESRRGNP